MIFWLGFGAGALVVLWLLVGLVVAVRLDVSVNALLWWPLYLVAWAVIRNRGRRR